METESTAPNAAPPAHKKRLPVILGICAALLVLLVVVRRFPERRGVERVMVSGAATYRDEPIVVGQIRFSLIPPSKGPLTIEPIHDGKFNTSLSGGLPVGNHRVEIKMYRPEEYATMGRSPGSPAPEQLLPEKYNSKSELTLNVPTGSDPIVHDFHLTD